MVEAVETSIGATGLSRMGDVALPQIRRIWKTAYVVEKWVTDGMFFLQEKEELPYGVIPYFRLSGPEYQFDDGQVVPRGLVHQLKDTNQLMDFTVSDWAFKVGVQAQGRVGRSEGSGSRESVFLEGHDRALGRSVSTASTLSFQVRTARRCSWTRLSM